ncbi:MAG: hypothetical protein GEU80_03325 [Dehalococcoidia bacterium]|nr:hypothetical protein [Dehalococcoidia bacterium]
MSDRTERLPAGPREVTPRQIEVARLVAEGRTNEEIADTLGISHAGAKYHVSELLGRLGLTRREEIRDWYGRHRSTQRRRAVLALPLGALVATGAVAALAVAAVVLLVAPGGRAEEPGEIPGLVVGTEVEERQSLSNVEAVFAEVEDGGILHLRVTRFVRAGQEVQAGRNGDFFTLPERRVEDSWWLYDDAGDVVFVLGLVRDGEDAVYQRTFGDAGNAQTWFVFPAARDAEVLAGIGTNTIDDWREGFAEAASQYQSWLSADEAFLERLNSGLIQVVRESAACGMNPLGDAPDKTHVLRKNEVDPATYFGTRSSCWAVMPDASEVLLTSDAAEFHAIDTSRWKEIEAFVWPDGLPTPTATPKP